MAAKSATGKPMSKSEINNAMAEATGMTKKEVGNFFDALTNLIADNVGKKGPKVFNLPGLLKISVQYKPATKERPGINPFTNEPTVFKAKPARNVIKIRPLKGLKDMA